MSKFSDRLKRLHTSRVRADEAAQKAGEERAGVYRAADVAETYESPSQTATAGAHSHRSAERAAWEAVGATRRDDVFWLDNRLADDATHGRYTIGQLADLDLSDISRELLGLFAAPAGPADTVFIDLETAGLGEGPGNEAWCVGLGNIRKDGFDVRHYVLPHPDLERPMLEAVAEHLKGARLIVSFNGEAFDLPRLRGHFGRHGIEDPTAKMDHIDLLKVARRLLPRDADTSLAGSERSLLGFERRHDVPGSESPKRWSRYLRTLNVRPLLPLVEHNKLDIVSLAVMLVHVQRALSGRAVPVVDRTRPLPTPARDDRPPAKPATTEENSEFRKKLVRSYRLKNKSDDKRVRRTPRRQVEATHIVATPEPRSTGGHVGDRLTELRRQAAGLLQSGDDEQAIPLLHEMLALSPRNPFPLAELARYYRDVGDDDLANLFEARLRDVAPY